MGLRGYLVGNDYKSSNNLLLVFFFWLCMLMCSLRGTGCSEIDKIYVFLVTRIQYNLKFDFTAAPV